MSQHLATQPKVSTCGRSSYTERQTTAAASVVSFAKKVQSVYVQETLYSDCRAIPASATSSIAPIDRPYWIGKVYRYQFDCASQRLKAFMVDHGAISKGSCAAQIMHVLMQRGSLHTWKWRPVGSGESSQPIVMAAVGFEGNPNTDMYLAAILDDFPLPVEDVGKMMVMCQKADSIQLYVISDRASTNYTTMLYIFELIDAIPSLVIDAHLEPCGCHGASLVKGRSSGGKKQVQA